MTLSEFPTYNSVWQLKDTSLYGEDPNATAFDESTPPKQPRLPKLEDEYGFDPEELLKLPAEKTSD